ncbi:MAG: DNRLRE domain-containing protein [Planctomycetes bacterium]|nr:DNRLRE domain-containing protein [Planctomycetota bacterium]
MIVRKTWEIRIATLAASLVWCCVLTLSQSAEAGGSSTGLIPITELPPKTYQGFEGGLYPGGVNEPPAAHLAAGLERAGLVQPRNTNGDPDPDGFIAMISIGMSSTAQEFGLFERQEDLNTARNGRVLIINTAQGGQAASVIANPAAAYWDLVDERLAGNGLTPPQVQIAWLKEANALPPDNFPVHAEELSADLRAIVQILKDRFPNIELCYLSSRIYAGYAQGPLNPEPQAYESGFAVKWLIEDQINGDPDLNFDPDAGPIEAPWLAWGPYLWADGLVPRADGLIWEESDFESDGVHPSPSGEQKVADMLSAFFAVDPTARKWHPARPGVALRSVDPVADAHVLQSRPKQNFGDANELHIGAQSQASNIYVKFAIGGITEPILFAKLSFRVSSNATAPTAQVFPVEDDSWTEAGITWANAPPFVGRPVAVTAGCSRDGSVSADVTQAVRDRPDDMISLGLVTESRDDGALVSREGLQPPRLILLVEPQGGPGDLDGDGDVDVADYALFLFCFTGPNGGPASQGCSPVDFEPDGDIDLADFGQFQLVFTGS